jgi:ABC-type Fe3+ transport system permease subunit
VILTHCSDGSWCCGTNNLTSCCDRNLGFQIAASIPPYAASATAGFTATATATVSSTSIPSSGQSNANNSLGIGLGVALGIVLLAVAVLGFVLYRRHRVRLHQDGTIIPEAAELGYHTPKREPVEMYGGAGSY